MADYAVSTAFNARDRVSPAFRAMGRAAYKFGRSADRSFNRASKSGSRFGAVVKGIVVASAIQKSMGLLTSGANGVTESFVAFDDAVVGAGARFKDIGPNAKNFDKRLQAIKDSAREVGATTQFTATQAAQGLEFMARVGFDSAQAIGSLTSMINLATAAKEDFATATSYAADLMGAFGLRSKDNATQLKNLNRLNDVLVKTANSSNVSLEDMFETMKTAAPIAKLMSISLEETAALVGTLGNAGIKGTLAATALKNANLRIATPKVQKKLESLGVAFADMGGNMLPLPTILKNVAAKTKHIGALARAGIFNELFGLRAIAGASAIAASVDELASLERALKAAGGTSKQTADIIRTSWGNQLKILVSSITEVGFKILSAFSKDGKRGIADLIMAIRKFDVTPIVDGLRTTINAIKLMYTVLSPFATLMPYLVGWFVAYKTILLAASAAMAIASWVRFVSIIYQMSGAMWALNAAFMANPAGLIAVGIVALGAAFIWLEKKFSIFSTAWNYWKEVFGFGSGDVGNVKLGLGADFDGMPEIKAPNIKEAQARQLQFQGRLDIAGAPEGSTLTTKGTGAPAINMQLLGMAP